jgi:hypothetical protein
MLVLCDLGDTLGSVCNVVVVFNLKTWKGYDVLVLILVVSASVALP